MSELREGEEAFGNYMHGLADRVARGEVDCSKVPYITDTIEKAAGSVSIGGGLSRVTFGNNTVTGKWGNHNGKNAFIATNGDVYQRPSGLKSDFTLVHGPSLGKKDVSQEPRVPRGVKGAGEWTSNIASSSPAKPKASKSPSKKTNITSMSDAREAVQREYDEVKTKLAKTKSPIWQNTYKRRLRTLSFSLANSREPFEMPKPLPDSEFDESKLNIARKEELYNIGHNWFEKANRGGLRRHGNGPDGGDPVHDLLAQAHSISMGDHNKYEKALSELAEKMTPFRKNDTVVAISGRYKGRTGNVDWFRMNDKMKPIVHVSFQPRKQETIDPEDNNNYVAMMLDMERSIVGTEVPIEDIEKVDIKKAFWTTFAAGLRRMSKRK